MEETCQHYQAMAGERVHSYLHGRGLGTETLETFRLGYVADPPHEHRTYAGRLAIPIIKKSGVVSFKFRCMDPHDCGDYGHPKYLSDGPQYLYNVSALDDPTTVLDVAEGEPDVWTLAGPMGLAAVGVPGATMWTKHPEWKHMVKGYQKIRFWADNDKAGNRLADQMKDDLQLLVVVHLPEGQDVNSVYVQFGELYLAELGGL